MMPDEMHPEIAMANLEMKMEELRKEKIFYETRWEKAMAQLERMFDLNERLLGKFLEERSDDDCDNSNG